MEEEIQTLKLKFNEIKKMGWIESPARTDCGIIGLTFEKLIGLPENQFEIPDFGNIEIKTKSNSRFANINLFNCVPTGPRFHEVERIKDVYGYPDSEFKDYKVLNGDVYANKLNRIGSRFHFQLRVDRNSEKITLCIYDKYGNKLEDDVYWDFDILEEKLSRKLTYLAIVNTDKRRTGGKLFFKYKTIDFYKLRSFDAFLCLIENGSIRIKFKLSIFKDEKRLGKICDRGTSFSIEKDSIDKLFERIS